MSSDDQYLSSRNRLFGRLQQLDDTLYFPESSRDTVKFVKLEFKFLDVFLTLQSYINEPNMLDVTQKVRALFEDALLDFSEFHLAEYFDLCTFKVQHKIWLTKMEIKAKYSFPKIASLPLSANEDGKAFTEFVMEFIDIVVENLCDLEKLGDPCSLIYVPKIKEHIKDALKELKMMQTFIYFVSERFNLEPDQSQHHIVNFFTHVLVLAGHASMLAWLYFFGCGTEDKDVALGEINVLVFLQMKFKPIQSSTRNIYITVLQVLKSTIQSGGWCPNIKNYCTTDSEANFLDTIVHNLVDLPIHSNSSQRAAFKVDLTILQEMLNFLRANIIRVPIQDLELLLRDIDPVVINVGLLVYSSYEGEEEKEGMPMGELNSKLVLDLSGNIQSTITTIYLTIRKVFQSELPKIHGLGYVDFLLNNLKEFQRRHSDSLAYVNNKLQKIQEVLEHFQPFLEAVSEEQHNELDEIQRCVIQVISRAYEVEFLVDACINKTAPVWCIEQWLLHIKEEITGIRDEVEKIRKEKMQRDAKHTTEAHVSSSLARSPENKVEEIREKKTPRDAKHTTEAHVSSSSARLPENIEEIVGFKDVIERLRDKLIKGTSERDVIAIVGMPGLGKTTLANRLYSDNSVVSHFDIRAHYTVSQVYSREDLLQSILHDVIENYEYRANIPHHELANKLRKALFFKRYLILIDDVWEPSVWDNLRGCFHDANNGSRIILTTRNHEVANDARIQSEPLLLRMFTNEESWELLKKKVFGEESCPSFLTDIGQQIARNCGRLPLSVALVAGILSQMEKKEECWQQLAKNLGPHIHGNARAIIEKSYLALPYHIRCCFLYFGAFLEDREIRVSKLARLWISEGFVKSCKSKSLEDTAECYLENLIGRNLVMGTIKSSGGKIKACRLHDLLHDFCKEKAKEKNHCRWMNWNQNGNPSSPVNKHLANRVAIYGEEYQIGEWSLCSSNVSSIILHNNCLTSETLSHILYKFKFLKVLDLELIRIDSLPTGLVYLRYCAANTDNFYSISSFLTSSWNLETLILHRSPSRPLPIMLCQRMINLHIPYLSFTGVNLPCLNLYNLKTLSTLNYLRVADMQSIFQKTPNLRVLRCRVRCVEYIRNYVLNFPTKIEKLTISRIWTPLKSHLPFRISAPNLKKLTLEEVNVTPQLLKEVSSLQNLQVLRLRRVRFNKPVWKVSSGEFSQLKVLRISSVSPSIKKWIVADDAFPNLERLVLYECDELDEIPSCIGDISTLKCIEIYRCNRRVDESARDIRKRQVEDYQNYSFEVFIQERPLRWYEDLYQKQA